MMLQHNFTNTFLKQEYAIHRANILWSRHESLIPRYQLIAERQKKAGIFKATVLVPLLRRKEILERELDDIEQKIHSKSIEYVNILQSGPVEVVEKKTFTRKCATPDCKGWLSSAWKCGICENYVCNDCFLTIGPHRRGTPECTHTCTPDDIGTAELIRNLTRPCPKCGHGIEKKEGCDMMFCTSCHTPFNWATGKIVTHGTIHNPHYYEWLQHTRDTGRAHGDIPCGGIPHNTYLQRFNNESYTIMSNIHRLFLHVQEVEMNRHHGIINNRGNWEDMMVRYILNEETKENIQRSMQQAEIKRERSQAFYDILNTFVTIGSNYLRQISDATEGRVDVDIWKTTEIYNAIHDIASLIEFTNNTTAEIAKSFGVSYTYIQIVNDTWEWSIIKSKSFNK
jgi:hypothetical protein